MGAGALFGTGFPTLLPAEETPVRGGTLIRGHSEAMCGCLPLCKGRFELSDA
jgi:hypothetical protein